jgi:hypothetical protein
LPPGGWASCWTAFCLRDLLRRHHGRLINRGHAIHGREKLIDALRTELIAQPALQLRRRQQPSALRVLDRDGERVEHFAPVDPYRLMIESVSAVIRGDGGWLPDPRWSMTVAHAMDAIRDAT